MLEEYEKSEIVNNAYMRRIMQVLENIKETKKIISKQNKFILQITLTARISGEVEMRAVIIFKKHFSLVRLRRIKPPHTVPEK